MSIELVDEVICVRGSGRIEDAETMTGMLQEAPGRVVDLTAAETLHTALWQVLLVFRPPLLGPSGDAFLNRWLLPLLPAASPFATQTDNAVLSERP